MALDLDCGGMALTELASGVDALYLSGQTDLPAGLVAVLDARREAAIEAQAPVEFAELGDGWVIEGRSFGKYRYCLSHEYGQIGVTESTALPTLRVQPRAGLLHGLGPRAALGTAARGGDI